MNTFPHSTLAACLITALLFGIGLWGINLHAQQARDTIRKLDIEDIETSLRRILTTTGTLPPATEPTWCGRVHAPENADVRATIEASLRATTKYANPAKPFPADPRFTGTAQDYLYWKTSPISFELASVLEADNSNTRDNLCGTGVGYDYAVTSTRRFAL